MKTLLQTFSLSQKAGFSWFGYFVLNGSLRQYFSRSCRFSGKRGEEKEDRVNEREQNYIYNHASDVSQPTLPLL